MVKMVGIERSFSKVSKYGSPVGRVMVREATLLNRQEVDRMLYSDYEEALGVTFDTVYGPYLQDAKVAEDIESGLERFLQDQYHFLDDACSGTLVAEFLHIKYDFHNLRVIAKKEFLGDSGEDRLFTTLGSVPPEALEAALGAQVAPGIPDRVAEAVQLARAAAVPGEVDSQTIDTLVDRAFLEARLDIARAEGSRPLESFCRSAIDVANLVVMLRGPELGKDPAYYEAALSEGGELPRRDLLALAGRPFSEVAERLLRSRYGQLISGALEDGMERVRLTSLDRLSDDYLMEKIAAFSRIAVGPERLVRYMMTRESEVAILRIIFVGKLISLTPAIIEKRLPLGYLTGMTG